MKTKVAGQHLWKVEVIPGADGALWILTERRDVNLAAVKAKRFLKKNYLGSAKILSIAHSGTIDA
jgi:hypothetical protein